MIFAFVEDGTLEVFGTAAEAIRQFEGIDVESGSVSFYDDRGTYLGPRFTTPNRRGKILGVLKWVQSGTYELVPDPTASADSFALALYETQVLAANEWFSSLEELKATLTAKGVPVRFEPKTRHALD